MKFCILEEDDKKNFEYFIQYLETINDYNNLQRLDYQLQQKEITDHIQRTCCEDTDKEKIKWIADNAKNFRDYINTLKIASLVFCIQAGGSVDVDTVSFEEFKNLESKINQFKECLDTIF